MDRACALCLLAVRRRAAPPVCRARTHYGYSYFTICQAIDRLGLGTAAYAVDTWQGDEHAGFYDESVFQSAALRNCQKILRLLTLLRATFDEALGYFAEKSVDRLRLHIDGRHRYEDVLHDFTTWRPKLTDDAVVLFHDTEQSFCFTTRMYGSAALVCGASLRSWPRNIRHFNSTMVTGLGVLIPGGNMPPGLSLLLHAPAETADRVRATSGALGAVVTMRREVLGLRSALASGTGK